jgi:plastocyanin
MGYGTDVELGGRRDMKKLIGLALIAVLVAAVAAPALASTSAVKHPVKNAKVDDDGYRFLPTKMTIKKGTKVVWKWVDGHDTLHNLKVTKGPVKFHSKLQLKGTFSHLFSTKGTYVLHCTLHPYMHVTVIVK